MKYFLTCILIFLVLLSCGTPHSSHLTEPLFLMPNRITISHYGEETGGVRTLNEDVTYTEEVEVDADVETTEPVGLDTTHVYAIPSVTVVSKARFAPVREGQVNIDFVIKIPKEFLSDDYQICLTPELLHNDSLVKLENVVLRGKNFIEKQKQDYERYNEYVATIIDPMGYDTAFINHTAVEQELERRRKAELNTYYTRWSQYQEYLKWQATEQEKYDLYNIQERAKFNQKVATSDRAYNNKLVRMLSMGQDTTLYAAKYRTKRKKLLASAPVHKQITLGTVPAKYRDIYQHGIKQQDIEPLLPEEKDSIRIASEHVMHERIALNEIKGSRKEEVFNRMVPTPYQPDAHYNATIAPEWNFTYRYTRPYPVKGNLKNLKLTLKGYITATDRSNYNIRRTDTLSYVISSMDELADGSLLSNTNFTDNQRRDYTAALQLLRNREYKRALDIFTDYKDYNTALTLACLGYNKRAYNLIITLGRSANNYYLAAILSTRLGDDQQAIQLLEEACKMDETKRFRADRDPEMSALVRKYGLTI
ncbi:hypothetical protein [Bacteroides sp. 224]|uniref:hypothetical protein n=1 Tax=Bacteroides sp. 224 TaxID=2302936 RepID=UPI0013D67A4D|nr:hypothetical protein [Bacteroides sp. 224]